MANFFRLVSFYVIFSLKFLYLRNFNHFTLPLSECSNLNSGNFDYPVNTPEAGLGLKRVRFPDSRIQSLHVCIYCSNVSGTLALLFQLRMNFASDRFLITVFLTLAPLTDFPQKFWLIRFRASVILPSSMKLIKLEYYWIRILQIVLKEFHGNDYPFPGVLLAAERIPLPVHNFKLIVKLFNWLGELTGRM